MSYHQKKIQSFLASRELLHDSHVRGSLFIFFFFAFPLVESLFTKFIRIGFSEEYLEFCIQIVFERRVLLKFYDSLMILQ